MADFMTTLNYASVNEDWRTEARGLRLRPDDRLLCVTGSGARPLDLLAQQPCHIVAIDLNPVQSALLKLKMAALREWSFGDYSRFVGLESAPEQWRMERLRGLGLDHPWPAELIEPGVLYQGRWEKHFRRVARIGRMLRGPMIRQLFAFDELDAQRAFVDANWNSTSWRSAWRWVMNPTVSRLFFGDPAFFAHPQISVGSELFDRMGRLLQHCLARESFMASLVLKGDLSPDDLPPHLTPSGVQTLRSRLDQVEIITTDLIDHLEQVEPGTYTRLSLSDVPSFLDEAAFERLIRAAVRVLEPGGRVAIRQFLTRYIVPADLDVLWRREPDLEKQLALEDRSFAYEFIVAEVPHGS